jgi:hypothetical protein
MTPLKTLVTGVFAITVALAANNTAATPFEEIASRAVDIQKDASWMRQHLKAKQFDRQLLEERSNAVEQNIVRLKELVASLDASAVPAGQQEKFELMKTKVELLDIFHGKKKELLTQGDLARNRAWLRAHADGIAKRAGMLQKTASQMN